MITGETLDTEMECDKPVQTSDHIAPPQHSPTPQDRAPPPGTTPQQDRAPPSSTDVTSLSEEDQIQFATLVSKAKEQMLQGEAAGALQSYRQASQIYPSNKLQAKILKLQVGSTDRRWTSLLWRQTYLTPCKQSLGVLRNHHVCLLGCISVDMIFLWTNSNEIVHGFFLKICTLFIHDINICSWLDNFSTVCMWFFTLWIYSFLWWFCYDIEAPRDLCKSLEGGKTEPSCPHVLLLVYTSMMIMIFFVLLKINFFILEFSERITDFTGNQ